MHARGHLFRFYDRLNALRDFVDLVEPVINNQPIELILNDRSTFIACCLLSNVLEGPRELTTPLAEALGKRETTAEEALKEFGISLETTKTPEGRRGVSLSFETNTQPGPKPFEPIDIVHTMNRMRHFNLQATTLLESGLVSLVSSSETYFSELLHYVYSRHPERSELGNAQLTYNLLLKFGTIEHAREYLLEQHVEGVLRGSFMDWIDHMKKKLHLSMGYFDQFKDELLETFLRRNLLVHNAGVVNNTYLKKAPDRFANGTTLGTRLDVSHEYLDERINVIQRVFGLFGLEEWKNSKEDVDGRSKFIIDYGYELMRQEQWCVAEGLYGFQLRDKSTSEADRMCARIDYWLCLKRQNRFGECKRDIDESDFSAVQSKFTLAKHVLLDEFDEAFSMLPNLLQKPGELKPTDLAEWPLFSELRSDDRISDYMP